MKQSVIHEGDSLIIKSVITNKSLSNKELLKTAIENIDESTKKVVLLSKHLKKEYDASLLKGLKDLGTTNPIADFIAGKEELSKTLIIKKAKKYMKKGINANIIYNQLFNPKITPLFINSFVSEEKPKGYRIIKEYSINESIIKVFNKGNQFLYFLEPFEFKCDYDKIKSISNTLIEIENMDLSLTDFKEQVIKTIEDKSLDPEVKNIIKRHSIGFGLIDIVFADEQVQDVYFYSSGGNLHINHSVFGDCGTNIRLSKKDVEAIATKIRVASGRPFDDSFPVIDYELADYNLRVCGVREPLTFKGVGYAFRKHRRVPWSLSDFIENSMLSPEVAGLLNFLVDGQCSILVTGPRGSGKTSLLSALINEVPASQRIIVIEDTPELPVNKLSEAGFKIQHLRIKPPLKERSTGYELSAEEALRTALRLGESVLVIGEVRGEEARALFEAMRVGATGNVVLGTIHGSTVYDTFDRVVNDLKVPPTSFKSTDIIISCANLRRGESLLTDRRVTSISEVQKQWVSKPVFNELTVFDHKTKSLKLSPRLKESHIIKNIAGLKGLSVAECVRSIRQRSKAKELLVKLRVPRNPQLVAEFNNKTIELLAKNDKNYLSELRKYLDSVKRGL